MALRRKEGGLPEACMANCEQIATVPKAWIEPAELGLLSAGRLRELELALL